MTNERRRRMFFCSEPLFTDHADTGGVILSGSPKSICYGSLDMSYPLRTGFIRFYLVILF